MVEGRASRAGSDGRPSEQRRERVHLQADNSFLLYISMYVVIHLSIFTFVRIPFSLAVGKVNRYLQLNQNDSRIKDVYM